MKDLSNDKNISSIIVDLPSNLLNLLNNLQAGTSTSVMIIKNNPHYKDGAVLFLYAYIYKTSDSYIIRIVNWLNWIHELHSSVSNSYDFIENLEHHIKQKILITPVSDKKLWN